MKHHFWIEIFTATIDQQLHEPNSRFSEQTMTSLVLSWSLSPKDDYKSFKVDDICNLVEKYYRKYFSEQEKILLEYELQHYKLDVPKHLKLQNLNTIVNLCRNWQALGSQKVSSTWSITSLGYDSSHFNYDCREIFFGQANNKNESL